MAALDQESQRIVVHVVYDGPAYSGKTTNVKQLMGAFTDRRRSELYSPGSDGERTKFLDWLKVDTGLVSGRRLSCHFITVPGQRVLARRRRFLLSLADVVVFVCTAEPDAQGEVDASFTSLMKKLDEMEARPPMVVQLNKTDLPGAITPEALRGRLKIPDDVAIVSAQANQDSGVKETAVHAIRHAADRIQDYIIVNGIDSLPTKVADADELHQMLIEHEKEDGRSPLEFVLDAHPLAPPGVEPRKKRDTEPAPSFGAQQSENLRQIRIVEAQASAQPAFPAENTPSGMIWPANQGREYMRRALHQERDVEERRADLLEYQAGPWTFSTIPKRVFAGSDDAKGELLNRARASIQLGQLCVPRLVWCVASTPAAAWLWRVAQDPATVQDHLEYSLRTGNLERATDVLEKFCDALSALENLSLQVEQFVPRGLNDLGLLGESCRFLLPFGSSESLNTKTALAEPLLKHELPATVTDRYLAYIRQSFASNMVDSVLSLVTFKAPSDSKQPEPRTGAPTAQSASRTGTDPGH